MGAFFFEGTKVAKNPNRPAGAPAAPTEARALIDLPAQGVKSGQAFAADPAVIAALVLAGEADPHPDAVAAAKQ